MSEFKEYSRKGLSELTPWIKGFNMKGVEVSKEDKAAGSPKKGDMIARNPKNHKDMWLIAKKYFEDNLELFDANVITISSGGKSYGNTTASGATKNVKDIVFWGDGDQWRLIGKASSANEKWMKSTKAMQFPTGCMLQVTTQQGDQVAEAINFVPGIRIVEHSDETGENVISRSFEAMPKAI